MSDDIFKSASMTQEQWEMAFENVKMDTPEQLMAALAALIQGPEGGHDYNTSGISMSIAAQLVFNYVAREVGASGFQASYAALHAYGKLMRIDGPFGIVKAEDALFPQYDLPEKVAGWIEEWKPWLRDHAKKMLDDAYNRPGVDGEPTVHPDVWAHWEQLATYDESSEPRPQDP